MSIDEKNELKVRTLNDTAESLKTHGST